MWKQNPGGTTFNRTWHDLLYAEDVAVFGHVAKHAAENTEDMTTVALWIGLTIKRIQNQNHHLKK